MDAPPFPSLATGPLVDIVGGGPFTLIAGQVTDDTHMAVCLADSLVACSRFDRDDVASRYVAWAEHAFDIGAQTSAALGGIRHGEAPRLAGEHVWIDRGRQAAGNGSLMRTAPIGVLISGDVERRQASFDDSAITHFDPRCQLACAIFNAAIAAGVRGGSKDDMMRGAADELGSATEALREQLTRHQPAVDEALAMLRRDLDAASARDPSLYGDELHLEKQQGYVRVAFRLAFWHLTHTPTIEAALIDTANRGGDADTNGAIVGALLGARDGEEAIPGAWRRRVLEALQSDVTPLSTTYHPRHFMEDLAKWFAP
jgi:ADP-ribosylglycohydrolase